MPTPKSKRTIVQQSSNHDSESDSTTEEFLLGASSVDGKTSRTITVTNTNDSGPGSLRNAIDPSQDESTESAGQDILTGVDYSEISSYEIIETDNGDDSVFRSKLGIINTGNGNDSITPSRDQGIGTKFITGGNANDSLAGNGQDSVFGDERLDILIWGDYSESSGGETQFNGFPGLSISGNNTSRVTSTGDGYSDDNNSLESDYRATLYGGTGEDLFNGRSDTSSPLPSRQPIKIRGLLTP